MHIVLQRLTTSDNGTFGTLIIDNKPCFMTLEPPWNNNTNNVSCVPPGTYKAIKMFSEKFQKTVYVLENVPGRDLIEFHIGNKAIDTHGCILLGMEFSVIEYAIVLSLTAFNSFMSIMPKEGFTITINDVVIKEGASWI